MARQNRVRPDGQIVAVPDRGLFWGNRGCLHDAEGNLVRYSRGRNWLVCVLDYKGIRRTLCSPGRFTELFFLDEATALAAGHRPCGECRYTAYRAFKTAFTSAYPGEETDAQSIDRILHADRLVGQGIRRTYRAHLASLPDGAMLDLDGAPWLVHGTELLAWSFAGYTHRQPRPAFGTVSVVTPRATVATLLAGYRPELHPSAGEPRRPE